MTMTKTNVTRYKAAKVIGTPSAVIMAAASGAAQRAEAQRALAQIESEIAALREQLARGTRELPSSTATKILYDKVLGLITERPRLFRELVAETDTANGGENRVKGVLVRLQRDGHPVVNLGNGSRAIWFCDVHDRVSEIARGRRVLSRRR